MRKILVLLLFSMTVNAWGQNITGRITCQGNGIEGVPVSDGDVIVLTDKDGHYEMQSQKRNGYVFYTLPSGYEPKMKNIFNPQFWVRLSTPDVSKKENHDFQLKRVNNDKFRMMIGSDPHLANQRDDLKQFKNSYIPALYRELCSAREAGVPVYSMILGDLTWDGYWKKNNYDLHDFMKTCRKMKYPIPLFPVIGNHDNDPSIPEGEKTDFLSSGAWRHVVSPNYYSFNIGRVHFVVLDDIYYVNAKKEGVTYPDGIAGSRNYNNYVTEDQLAWLKQDLAFVDKDAPVIIGVHIPTMRFHPETGIMRAYMKKHCIERLYEMLKDFKQVHILSGHTHVNYCAHMPQFPNIMEHNIDAICAVWWVSHPLSARHNCTDGSPAGYSMWDFDGNKVHWSFKNIQDHYDNQFRVYDMNTVKAFFNTNSTMKRLLKKFPKCKDYSNVEDNLVYVNVFAWDVDWKVEIFEDRKPLEVKRIGTEDPYHILCYEYPWFKEHNDMGGCVSQKTWHMFQADATTANKPITVRVTDSFGKVQERTIQRPYAYNLDMIHKQEMGY